MKLLKPQCVRINFVYREAYRRMDIEEKYRRNMECLDRWMGVREKGSSIADYLKCGQIRKVGIYGYGMLGKHLVYELQKKNFPIEWVMDKKSLGDERYSHIIRPNNDIFKKDVDLAIITTLADIEEIEVFLSDFISGQIISVEELINNVYRWRSQE